MPRVPTIERSVQRSGINLPRAPRDLPKGFIGAFSQGESIEAASRLTQTVANIFKAEKKKSDNLAITEKQNRVDARVNDLLTDPEQGLLTRQGKNAFSINDEFERDYREFSQEILKESSNDIQRNALADYLSRKKVNAQSRINAHMNKQITMYDNQQTETALINAANDAATNYRDVENISQNVARGFGVIEAQAARQGLDGEYVKAKKAEFSSNLHTEVINRMLVNQDDQSAKSYYDKFKDQILGTKRDDLEKAIEESSLRGDSQRKTDEIFQKKLSLEEALKEARKIRDPKRRDETVRRLKVRYQELSAQQKKAHEQLFLESLNAVDQNPGNDVRDLIPSQAWDQFSVTEKKALLNYHSKRPTDEKVWFEFYTQTLDPNRLGQMSAGDFYSKYYSKMSHPDRKRAESLYRDAVKSVNEGVSGSSLTSVVSFNDMVMSSMQRADIINESDLQKGPKKLSNEEFRTFRRITQEAQKRLEDFETSKGNKATPSEKQQIIDGILTERVFERDTFLGFDFLNPDDEAVPSLIDENDDGEFYVPYNDIPNEDVRDIEKALRDSGQEVTVDKVERLKAAEMIGDYNRVQRILRGDD